jgi:hypothetical protein
VTAPVDYSPPIAAEEWSMDSSFTSDPSPFAPPSLRTTSGELLRDGTVVDLVIEEDRLMLCHFDGTESVVVPYLEFDNAVYSPPRLEPSLFSALRFPNRPLEYRSLTALFQDAVAVFERRDFSSEVGRCCAIFALASWVPEFFFEPPTLVVYGSDMTSAAVLFVLLDCICRRCFRTPQLSRALPFSVQPTMMVLAPDSSAKFSAFWRAANMPGVRVPSRAGTVASLACTRVLFTNDEQALASWGPEALRLPLPPNAQVSPPTAQDLTKIANEHQSRLLMFRLLQLVKLNESAPPPKVEKRFVNQGISRRLLMLVEGEPEIVSAITPLLEEQEREFLDCQERDPDRAIIECLWSLSHTAEDISIKELKKRLNALLRTRGEIIEFDSRGLGWRLRRLGLRRQRNGSGMLLRFSADVRRQVHQSARNFNLDLRKFKNCPECK